MITDKKIFFLIYLIILSIGLSAQRVRNESASIGRLYSHVDRLKYYDFFIHLCNSEASFPNCILTKKRDFRNVKHLSINLDTIPNTSLYQAIHKLKKATYVSISDLGNYFGLPNLLNDTIINELNRNKQLKTLIIDMAGSSYNLANNYNRLGGNIIPKSLYKLNSLEELHINSNYFLGKQNDTIQLPGNLKKLYINALNAQSPYINFSSCKKLKEIELSVQSDSLFKSKFHSDFYNLPLEKIIYYNYFSKNNHSYIKPQSFKFKNVKGVNLNPEGFGGNGEYVPCIIDTFEISNNNNQPYGFTINTLTSSNTFIKADNLVQVEIISAPNSTLSLSCYSRIFRNAKIQGPIYFSTNDSVSIFRLKNLANNLYASGLDLTFNENCRRVNSLLEIDTIGSIFIKDNSGKIVYDINMTHINKIGQLSYGLDINKAFNINSGLSLLKSISKNSIHFLHLPINFIELIYNNPDLVQNMDLIHFHFNKTVYRHRDNYKISEEYKLHLKKCIEEYNSLYSSNPLNTDSIIKMFSELNKKYPTKFISII